MIREMDTLSVLMVTPRYLPYIGGIEMHVHEVGRRLVDRGINLTILTTMPHSFSTRLPREEIVDGMRIIRVPSWPRQEDYYIAPAMYSFITHGKWDLLHCQGCHTFVPPLAMLAAKKVHIPYLVTFHTGGHSSRFRTRMRGIQWELLRPLFTDATRLIGVSRFEANFFRERLHLPAKQFAVIPNGVSIPTLPPHPSEGEMQQLIISVGRLERFKGHQYMITALPKIREFYPAMRLLILGTGPYEAALHELARKVGVARYVEIRSIPASNRQEMIETLSQATLVTLLSEHEGHPIAVLEALALHRPVLVANTPGLQELAEEELVRAVSLNSTPEEIAAAALRQIEEPLIPAQFTLPTWDDCTEQLLSIYKLSVREKPCAS